MKSLWIVCSLCLLAAVLFAAAHAQPGPLGGFEPDLGVPEPKPAADAPYVVYGQHEGAIMMEMRTGKSWMLIRSRHTNTPHVWMPIERLETGMDVERWQKAENEWRAKKKKMREEG